MILETWEIRDLRESRSLVWLESNSLLLSTVHLIVAREDETRLWGFLQLLMNRRMSAVTHFSRLKLEYLSNEITGGVISDGCQQSDCSFFFREVDTRQRSLFWPISGWLPQPGWSFPPEWMAKEFRRKQTSRCTIHRIVQSTDVVPLVRWDELHDSRDSISNKLMSWNDEDFHPTSWAQWCCRSRHKCEREGFQVPGERD